ncbi:conserved hypothetical protein [Xenorhabdus innexi]|uniref:CoA-binding domain-containing protein n=1 Tax=Xenorhabdus innexi TaxID=290109 RepID=A0A1N6MVV8_9GAMM|nr:hypothetical protein [Xenorhabdus innexi]SIP72998.1 conserved hypothetical protein [Xenorhabdus innexi]
MIVINTVANEPPELLAENKGLDVIMDRCPKIELSRLGLEK